MTTIIKSKSGNYVYLYESESYRDAGKVKNKRRIVGKVDPKTGHHVYKPEYIEEKSLNLTDSGVRNVKLYSVNDVKQSVVKEYGTFYLLKEISSQIGLVDMLSRAMPTTWGKFCI